MALLRVFREAASRLSASHRAPEEGAARMVTPLPQGHHWSQPRDDGSDLPLQDPSRPPARPTALLVCIRGPRRSPTEAAAPARPPGKPDPLVLSLGV